jgi:hypothetical protein
MVFVLRMPSTRGSDAMYEHARGRECSDVRSREEALSGVGCDGRRWRRYVEGEAAWREVSVSSRRPQYGVAQGVAITLSHDSVRHTGSDDIGTALEYTQ